MTLALWRLTFLYMRCSGASIFYPLAMCSGIWVRACKARTAYTVLDEGERGTSESATSP